MDDTVTQARQEREQQGPWEVEISYGGEVDLHKHLNTCEKNPGHLKFIPVDEFNLSHLPTGCNDIDLVHLVRAMANLTVRVSVKYVSQKRPQTFPGNGKTYPCYKNRGRNILRVGTGWVCSVEMYPKNDQTCTTCECHECQNSSKPKTIFAHIQLVTAAHVVYDDQEGTHTTCHLFYDKGSKPEDCISVVTLTGMSDVMSNVERDWCEMTYITHDLDLANILRDMVDQWKCLERKLGYKYRLLKKQTSQPVGDEISDACLTLTIIVSHPHGCSKQVSVGHYIDRSDEEDSWTSYTYTTATCPGSSGAKVWLTGWGEYGFLYYIRTHCGNCETNRELNYCSLGYPTRNLN